MVSFAPTPQDSPRAPTVTMVRCLRTMSCIVGARMIPRSQPNGWEIVADSKDAHPREFLAWFPRWCGDRLIADGLVDSHGTMTAEGREAIGETE